MFQHTPADISLILLNLYLNYYGIPQDGVGRSRDSSVRFSSPNYQHMFSQQSFSTLASASKHLYKFGGLQTSAIIHWFFEVSVLVLNEGVSVGFECSAVFSAVWVVCGRHLHGTQQFCQHSRLLVKRASCPDRGARVPPFTHRRQFSEGKGWKACKNTNP